MADGPWIFRRWQRDGVWSTILTGLKARADAAGARRDSGAQKEPPGGDRAEPDDHGLGRSRGGWTTKIHLACEQGQKPLSLLATAGHIATLRGAPSAAPPRPPRPPTVRQVTGWLTRHPAKEVPARCPELDTAAGHVRDFGEMLTERPGSTLSTSIDAVDASQLPGLSGFALHALKP
ncbi:hypothetical protein ACFVRB_35785 [Streptomyces nojiriensis]|uniref:hypothetical protein n=1 Tax=Streptomyces nojiriensis TaxID=66374 RepID=UPI0036DE97A0